MQARLDGCTRRWSAATSRLWRHVGADLVRMNTSIDAGTVLAALADPTRRDVLATVAARSGTATATDLAAELPVTRQAIAKHLGVLADAGLFSSAGDRDANPTTAWWQARSAPPASDWIQRTEASWSRRVDRLQQHLADR